MRLPPVCLALCLTALASPALAQSVTITGSAGQVVEVTAAQLASLPRTTVAFDAHGVAHTFEGPLLIDVLALAGAPTGRQLRGAALANVVLATADDGYQVAFGLAEADPNTRPNRIILADRADDAPLDAGSGPLQLVFEGDLRPARSIRQLSKLEVRSLSTRTGDAHGH